MTAKAAMRTADLNRLLKAAKAYGFVVEFLRDGAIRLLPTDGAQRVPSDESAEDEAAWDRALGLQ
jgi:hypothetical protein